MEILSDWGPYQLVIDEGMDLDLEWFHLGLYAIHSMLLWYMFPHLMAVKRKFRASPKTIVPTPSQVYHVRPHRYHRIASNQFSRRAVVCFCKFELKKFHSCSHSFSFHSSSRCLQACLLVPSASGLSLRSLARWFISFPFPGAVRINCRLLHCTHQLLARYRTAGCVWFRSRGRSVTFEGEGEGK